MGRLLRRISGIAAVALVSLTTLTGCVDTDDDWWGAPPYGYTYNDPRLEGYWALVQYNSDPVSSAMPTTCTSTGTAMDIIIILTTDTASVSSCATGASSPTAEHQTIR